MAKRKLSVLDVLDNDPMNLLGSPDEDGEYEAEQSGHISVNGEDDEESDEDDEQKREEDEEDEEDIVMMPSPPPTASKKLGKRKRDNEGKSLSIASSGGRIHCVPHRYRQYTNHQKNQLYSFHYNCYRDEETHLATNRQITIATAIKW